MRCDDAPSETLSPAPPAAGAGPLLRVERAVKRFGGGAAVVDGLSFEVWPGEILGLVGPNGAGKTTMFDCLAGAQGLSGGRILFGGCRIDPWPAHRRARMGLARSFQIPKPFGEMSVVENVMVGAQGQRGEGFWTALTRPGPVRRQDGLIRERAMELLRFVTLERLAREPAHVLSGGQRKLLELARVLIGGPKLLLLDEPGAGVNPSLLEIIVDRILRIRTEGVTVLLIEHNMDMVAQLCSRVLVMAQGRRLAEGTPDEIARNHAVVDAYLGAAA